MCEFPSKFVIKMCEFSSKFVTKMCVFPQKFVTKMCFLFSIYLIFSIFDVLKFIRTSMADFRRGEQVVDLPLYAFSVIDRIV